jgi:outer membrane protein with beta-barrel domain
MGRFVLVTCIVFAGLCSPIAAQQRFEVGVFLDYLGISQTNTNNFGLGGRFGYRVHHDVMLEGELAYDYGVNFDEVYRDVTNGNLTAIENTSIGVTHGLFGPKLQPSGGGFRPFVTLKGGFVDFRLTPSLIPYSDVVSAVSGIRTSNLNFALYPAGGVEANLGPVGLRLEFGDEVYFNNGAHNNLRITFGPQIRF